LIAFELNDDGTVKSEKLLRSSGDAALDVESLALVQRAAPFPKPPAGAQKVFAADITFPPPK
jgi:TonB family protein